MAFYLAMKKRGLELTALAALSFDSQNPHDSSQTFVTPIPGNLKPSSLFHIQKKHTWYIYTHVGKKLIHKMKNEEAAIQF